MTVRNLEHLLRPASVAVIGASNRPSSLGQAVMENVLAGGVAGPVMPVNPRCRSVASVLAYASPAQLPVTPDLAFICTPAPTVPGIIAELGERGCRAAVVLSAGLRHASHESGVSLEQAMLNAAREYCLRIIGPGSQGLLVPGVGLNGGIAQCGARPGRLAVVHQSGALGTGFLDWAASRNIGFSHFVSIGDCADVDFGDLLDYLGSDVDARAILMYMDDLRAESHAQMRKFVSAARAASRNKPVLVIKSGRGSDPAHDAMTHSRVLASTDQVFDAAFKRAGILRVRDSDEMFAAVETLAYYPGRRVGERLAIVGNGNGPGLMAADTMIQTGGILARPGPQTNQVLEGLLPPQGRRGNPLGLAGDADAARYVAALTQLLQDSEVDAVLVLYAPIPGVSATEVAQAVIGCAAENKAMSRVFASWLGGAAVAEARRRFSAAGIPDYETPDGAVRGFMHRVRHQRNQVLLMETPPAAPAQAKPERERALSVVRGAIARGRFMLGESEAAAVLEAYGIPVVKTVEVATPEQAAARADLLGYPVALKIVCPEVSRSHVGGVALDMENAEAVQREARAMRSRVQQLAPGARPGGYIVQPMARRPGSHALFVGMSTDPIFGPVLLFGEGGAAVELVADTAVALPPLNVKLARELMAETRAWRRLQPSVGRAPVDLDAVTDVLLKVSQLVVDMGELVELDINPLLADSRGAVALDVRMRVGVSDDEGAGRLAIRPYPEHLEEQMVLGGEALLVRPIRPEDEPAHASFLAALDERDIRFRFFGSIRRFPHTQLARFTQIDYDREMAFIAVRQVEGIPTTVGVVRTVADPGGVSAEFAIVIGASVKGRGLGRALMQKIIDYCRGRGLQEIVGQVLAENQPMRRLSRSLGFTEERDEDPAVVQVRLKLNPP